MSDSWVNESLESLIRLPRRKEDKTITTTTTTTTKKKKKKKKFFHSTILQIIETYYLFLFLLFELHSRSIIIASFSSVFSARFTRPGN